ncbi:hypothetical protein DSUL_90070 [Desulfovibrionales bacterium]
MFKHGEQPMLLVDIKKLSSLAATGALRLGCRSIVLRQWVAFQLRLYLEWRLGGISNPKRFFFGPAAENIYLLHCLVR